MGATTRTGWPVPNLSDVVDGPAAFQAMGDPSALDVGAPG